MNTKDSSSTTNRIVMKFRNQKGYTQWNVMTEDPLQEFIENKSISILAKKLIN